MARVKRGVTAHARHKKVIKQAKGYRGYEWTEIKKSMQYAYRDRRVKKREFRSLWTQRINAGARLHGISYSVFMNGLKKLNIELDRKILADLAMNEPTSFEHLAKQVQSSAK